MASVRLTQYLRETIINRAIAAAFDDKLKDLRDREHALALEVYEAKIPKPLRDQLDSLPRAWLTFSTSSEINASGMRIVLNHPHKSLPRKSAQRRYEDDTIYCPELCAKIITFATNMDDHHKARKAARAHLSTLLSNVASISKLREVWPEGEEFYADLDRPKAALPALRVDELNAILGLPRETSDGK